jgi:uncharacterized protein
MGRIVWVFRNQHNELRMGWRLLLFLGLMAGLAWSVFSVIPPAFAATPLAAGVIPFFLVVLVTWLMATLVNHKPLAAVGLWFHPRALRECGLGLLVGLLMMTGIFVIELGLGTLHLTWRGLSVSEIAGAVGYSFVTFALSAMFEEMLFRGYLFQSLMQWLTFVPALLIMSLLFGVAHIGNPHATLLSTANVLLAGIWLSFAYLKTRSLWLPFGLHLAWNFSQTTLYAFPTSGFSFADRRLFDAVQTGPVWITGGEFGPEGGVLATIALIVATWYLLKTRIVTVPEGIITLDSVEDILPASPEKEGKA